MAATLSHTIRQFTEADTEQAVALWETCGLTRPWNDPRSDIARSLAAQPELFFAAVADQAAPRTKPQLLGTVMAGYDGHRGWMYYLATAPEARGAGIGRALVAEVERRLESLGCPKAQLMVRTDNTQATGFYEALGYGVNEVLVLGRRLIEDSPAA
ncbi:ribosomal protein S18 acetylase RimI-like enzyme [Leucobacter komagatae]|uniref:Ribosomal protein S18 acetylase RimI-like enzyme n=1 Tax=Leucobacter komagatae TaxID=55969 RepID=A0A542Y426_9MICO|nr:GNAT family acetyltransferase [Leucobacter komagatae]TQL42808.1 ribosomal protein S18 acetylase RimI-like enzyme [Leucobacter komagatae]